MTTGHLTAGNSPIGHLTVCTVCPVKFGTVSGETKFSKNHRNSSITIFQVFNTENVDSGNNELN